MWEWETVSANTDVDPDVPDLGITYSKYQRLPTPYREISKEKFLSYLTGSEILRAYMFEQLHVDWRGEEKTGSLHSVRFFAYSSYIIAISTDHSKRESEDRYMRYWRIGCNHDKIKEMPQTEMFKHDLWCPVCGYTATYWSD